VSFKESTSQENHKYVDGGHTRSLFSVYFIGVLACGSSSASMVLLSSYMHGRKKKNIFENKGGKQRCQTEFVLKVL